ncbi:MAG: hypothetical protein N3F67_02320 [Acidilobaceae archaeon]|nr:hypothetical protein [Acidilobaceae archaeon]
MGGIREEVEERAREKEEEAKGIARRVVALNAARGLWAYVGAERDYFMIDGLYCSCSSFAHSLPERAGCVHLAALRLAKGSGRFRDLRMGEEEVRRVIWEIISVGLSVTLRKNLLEEQVGQDDKEGEGCGYNEDRGGAQLDRAV